MSSSVQYEYSDGSANKYVITPTSLEYVPVRPEESSTGMYSGGEPKKVNLTQEQFEAIHTELQKAFDNTAVHIQDRMKGSGMIRITSGNERKQCILQQGSAEIEKIEAVLKNNLK